MPDTILVVDDTASTRYAVRRMLERVGFSVVEASSGEEALRGARAHPAVIVLDVRLPDLSGFEVARELRADPETAAIPVLHLSASYTSPEYQVRGLDAGADAYLTYPVDPQVLVATIRALLRIRRAEEAARAAAEEWRATFDAIRDGACLLDDAGVILRCNTPLAALLGDAPETLEGGGLHEAARRAFGQAGAQALLEHLRGGEGSKELLLGGRNYVATVRRPAARAGRVFTLADVTERRRSEDELQRSHGLLQAIVEGTTDAIFVKDAAGRYLMVNSAACRMARRTREELLGRDAVFVFGEEFARPLIAHDRAAMAAGEARSFEEVIPDDGGQERALLTTKGPLRDARGRVVGVVGIARDITERTRLERERARLVRELEEAVRARDEFLSMASHDLRAPLSAVLLRVDSLQRAAARRAGADAEAPLAGLSAVSEQLRRLTQMLDDLLDLSQITAGRLALRLEDVDLAEVARDVAARQAEQLTRAGCELRLDVRPAVGRWDRLRLDQVLSNLLSNAVKYGAGRPIDVAVAPRDGRAELRVKDHGVGIAPGDAERIFDRFERVSAAPRPGSYGIGLWVVDRIVAALGGTIRVESAPGAGTLFEVILPRGVAEGDREPLPRRPRRPSRRRPAPGP